MKLSSGWEQSVYVLLILSQLPDNKTINSQALSLRLGTSHSYLKKIIKLLVNEGLITSIPGKYGGFSLAKSLEEITFYDVFIAIEGRGKIFASQQLLKKFLGENEGKKAQKCAITDSLDIIENTLVTTLSSISLAQVFNQISSNYNLDELREWVKIMCNANRQNRALILGTLAMIITFMSWSSFGVLINNINLVVSMSQSQQKVLVAFPVLLGSLFRIPIGYLSDRYGGKRIYIILFLLTLLPLFTLFFIFLYFHPTYPILLILSTFIGISGASFSVST